jgi:anhydro-N-acetylmuramic acid kinase
VAWFIGLMSGTSLDGVDGVLAHAEGNEGAAALQSRAHAHQAFAPALREELLQLNRSGADELHRAALAANGLVRVYADVVAQLLAAAGLKSTDVTAIGAHGQTVRHRPGEFDGHGYTVQLINGALLAELSGIDVVCDFRSRDVAAGGQGAPLVPAFHAACFARPGQDCAVLNLGGIANLTLLRANGEVLGFDTGPGNILMDLWCQRHLDRAFDEGGRWAATGRVDGALLQSMLLEPYFARLPPKSTGRDLFDAVWLDRYRTAAVQDMMTTLTELTAFTVVQALQQHADGTTALLVCGGGAFNTLLMSRLAALSGPAVAVHSTAAVGVAPDHVEALAFAWLASAFVARSAGNLPAVTGALGPRVLGALYPAG